MRDISLNQQKSLSEIRKKLGSGNSTRWLSREGAGLSANSKSLEKLEIPICLQGTFGTSLVPSHPGTNLMPSFPDAGTCARATWWKFQEEIFDFVFLPPLNTRVRARWEGVSTCAQVQGCGKSENFEKLKILI